MPKLSGTYEHTTQMSHIINKAGIKQRSVVITLLDLKNAFGEVHHNLIPAVLTYYHIPHHIQQLINSLYSDFYTSIVSQHFITPSIKVSFGVLSVESLSPLTFNFCFNTFIRYIAAQKFRHCFNTFIRYIAALKFRQFGLSLNSIYPIHWIQFANDAAVITGLEDENQILLNHFTLWRNWAGMIVRVDKCLTLSIKKAANSSIQYLPKLILNSSLVPTVEKPCPLNTLVDTSISIWIIAIICQFFLTQ